MPTLSYLTNFVRFWGEIQKRDYHVIRIYIAARRAVISTCNSKLALHDANAVVFRKLYP